MNILLTNPVLWPLLLLVAVPVLLHLLVRSRPPAYEFSSTEFILRILRQSFRIRKPQDWILLVLRTGLVAAAVLVFLQPLFFSRQRLGDPFERKNLVLVVDATASMGYVEGAQTRFAAACAHASEILSGLTPRDTANIVWMKSRPAAEFPTLGINLPALRASLRRARVTTESASPSDAIRLARELLEGAEGRLEICILSDFQKTTWDRAALDLPPSVTLLKIRVGASDGENGAVSDLTADPARPLVGEEVLLGAEIRNYSARPKRRTVYFSLPDTRQSQDILVPAWGRAIASFRHRFSAPGPVTVTVTASEDAFPLDDSRWMVLEVRDTLHAGIVAGEEETAAAWRRALAALGWVHLESLSAVELAASPALDALFISGPLPSTPDTLSALLERGTTMFWYPGSNSLDAASAALTGLPAGAPPRWEAADTARRLRIAAPEDPAFQLFRSGEYGDPAAGTSRARLILPAPSQPDNVVLLAYDDGVPALLRRQATGHFYLWNLPLDPAFGAFAARMEFVPLLGELLLTSRVRAPLDASIARETLPGEPVSRRIEADAPVSAFRLLDVDGRDVSLMSRGTGRDAVVGPIADLDPGLYAWQFQGRAAGFAVVQFPAPESDLRTLTPKDIEKEGAVGLTEGRMVRRLRDGIPLWPWLLAAAGLLAIVEGTVVLWARQP